MEGLDLGYVITVVDGRPIKYSVHLTDNRPNTSDPLNRTPISYVFKDLSPSTGDSREAIEVKVSHRVSGLAIENAGHTLHNWSIRYGLQCIRSFPEKNEFIFTSDEFERLKASPLLEGPELRFSILKFQYDVYKLRPSEPISSGDLADNLHADEQQIREWRNDLAHAHYLKVVGSRRQSRVRGRADEDGYTIAPDKRREIEAELDDYSKSTRKDPNDRLLVFLSYSTKDKVLAGRIKASLMEAGFHVFMAHEDLVPSEDWIKEIRKNLRNCDVLIPILSPNFRGSVWTDQETGFALASDKIIIPLMFESPPHGFLGQVQALKASDERPELVAERISAIVRSKLRHGL